ncbi:MAG: ATP-binding protein [Thermodesulfobacteriota bacterium]
MKFENSTKHNAVRFHRRNALQLLGVLVFLLAVVFVLLGRQRQLTVEHEGITLLNDFQEQVSNIENLVAAVTARVEGMRTRAESELFEMRLNPDFGPPAALASLSENKEWGGFHMDDLQPSLTRDRVGNLTGLGPIKTSDVAFRRELCMALNLNPDFRSISKAIKDAAWVYYTSASNFINIYPWVSSKKFRFSKELLSHEFFLLGLPENNPKQTLFWTEVYVDEYGKGLMTTCAAPVYDDGRFLGTVAIDLTVDFLNTNIRQFRIGKGEMFLVNNRNQLLAHPLMITSKDRNTKPMDLAFPEDLRAHLNDIVRVQENRIAALDGYRVMRRKLSHAPWTAFYVEAEPSEVKAFVQMLGVGPLVLMAGLLMVVIAILTVTHRHFVIPSGKLVDFIMARSRRDHSRPHDDVPSVWRPWFQAIESAFKENEELTERIRKQNEELEIRVAERTARLEEANLKLRIEIEEHKQAEEEKERLQTQLERAHKMEAIGMLAGGVAHDLNNVLSGLVSYPQLLLMQIEPESPLRNPIRTIQKSGERAAAIVQDLLMLARRSVPTREAVNLNEIIEDYLKSVEFESMRSHCAHAEVRTDLEKGLLSILGSRLHLSKCVMNLVTNALEAMPEGGTVRISTANTYIDRPIRGFDNVESGDYVVFTVEDTGIGISTEDQDRIFEPFYTKKVMGRSGTGLGMAVVWGTVKDHNGYIDVQSTPGKGTLFRLYFPATRKEVERLVPSAPLETFQGRGELVLLVDDAREQREIGSMILQILHYSVDAAASGEEAVEYVKTHSPDLIILDMIMDQGMDGLDTYKRIVEIRPAQKAILVSGFSETDRVREAQRLGAGEYVKKPYLMEKIAAAVRKALDA